MNWTERKHLAPEPWTELNGWRIYQAGELNWTDAKPIWSLDEKTLYKSMNSTDPDWYYICVNNAQSICIINKRDLSEMLRSIALNMSFIAHYVGNACIWLGLFAMPSRPKKILRCLQGWHPWQDQDRNFPKIVGVVIKISGPFLLSSTHRTNVNFWDVGVVATTPFI